MITHIITCHGSGSNNEIIENVVPRYESVRSKTLLIGVDLVVCSLALKTRR